MRILGRVGCRILLVAAVVWSPLPAVSQAVAGSVSIDVAPLPVAVQDLARDVEAARASAEPPPKPELIEIEGVLSELQHALEVSRGDDPGALARIGSRLRAAQSRLETTARTEEIETAGALRDPLDRVVVSLDDLVAELDPTRRRALATSLLELMRPADPTAIRHRQTRVRTVRTDFSAAPEVP